MSRTGVGTMVPLSIMSLALVVLAIAFPVSCRADDKPNVRPVKVEEDKTTFTLSNGIVRACVSKRSGDLTSLRYKGMETLTDQSGHPGAYWSHDTTGGKEIITRITIDPQSNGGERGEVSIKGISGGNKMGHGPGAGR